MIFRAISNLVQGAVAYLSEDSKVRLEALRKKAGEEMEHIPIFPPVVDHRPVWELPIAEVENLREAA